MDVEENNTDRGIYSRCCPEREPWSRNGHEQIVKVAEIVDRSQVALHGKDEVNIQKISRDVTHGRP